MCVDYEYDFGSPTALKLKVYSMRRDHTPLKKIALLARNLDPDYPCEVCDEKTATIVCVVCMWDGSGWLCDECAKEHRCTSELLRPVVNSPRVGQCGYCG